MGYKVFPAKKRLKRDIDLYAGQFNNKHTSFDIIEFFDIDLESIANVTTDYRKLPQGIHGYTNVQTRECIISVDIADGLFGERYYRTTVAHEVGHALMHVSDYQFCRDMAPLANNGKEVMLFRKEEIKPWHDPEWQAWYFAGALLMPEKAVKCLISNGCNIYDLANHFNVNPAFVKVRLDKLKLYI